MQADPFLDHRYEMHIYDYIIIGSGLTGLTIAQKISEETKNIVVLEAHDFPGGDNRAAGLNNHVINNGLRFLPGTQAAEKAFEFLQSVLKENFNLIKIENNPETYDANGFKPFVGFGSGKVDFYDQLSYFLTTTEFKSSKQPYEWLDQLISSLKDIIQTKSIVTRFGFENNESEKSELTHVVVNGTKQIYARNFIFTGAVKDLNLLLPDEVLNLRSKAKLKKSQSWQGICLDLFHTHSVSKNNLFILNGTTDDDLGPCVGRFINSESQQGQISQWLSFIDSELAEDTENIGLVLKKIKRQIKRAFPEVADSIIKEKIFITPEMSGADLKLTAEHKIPKVENLWIASSVISKEKNLVASLQQAQIVLASLGFLSTVAEFPKYEEAILEDQPEQLENRQVENESVENEPLDL